MKFIIFMISSFCILNVAKAIPEKPKSHVINSKSLEVMSEIIEAGMQSSDVRIYLKNANFESVKATYSPDSLNAVFEVRGTKLFEGDISCGELFLKIERRSEIYQEWTMRFYTAKLDKSRFADYCTLEEK